MGWTRREPQAGLGYRLHPGPPDAVDGRRLVEPDSFAPTTSQPTGRNRRAGGRSAVRRIPDGTVHRRDNQWGIPRKRALFVSDGPDSTTSGSDVLEGHYGRPPDDHRKCIRKRNYVLRVDNWKKQWSGCSKTLQIIARSSDSVGHRLRRSLLGLRNGRGLSRRFAAAFSPGRGCPQRSSTGPGVSASAAGTFGEILVGTLQFSRAVGRIQASV